MLYILDAIDQFKTFVNNIKLTPKNVKWIINKNEYLILYQYKHNNKHLNIIHTPDADAHART